LDTRLFTYSTKPALLCHPGTNLVSCFPSYSASTLIFSHNLAEVEKLANQIAIINRSTEVVMGSLDELNQRAGPGADSDLGDLFRYFTSNS
jgi:hypothetical protein